MKMTAKWFAVVGLVAVVALSGCKKRAGTPAKPGKPAAAKAETEGPTMSVGTAHVDMTPEGAVPLAGYGSRYGKLSKGVHDPVYARAVVVQSGKTTLAMVSCDLCGLTESMCTEAGKMVQEAGCPVPPENIMVAGTHTHAGPGGYGNHPLWAIAIGNYQQKIYEKLRDSIAQSIIQACKNMRPAKLATGSAEILGFNRNRRGEKTVDRQMGMLRFDGEDGKPIAVVINFTGHPTIIGGGDMLMSRGWPGALVDSVIAHYGEGTECLFFNGAQGDQSGYLDGGGFKTSYDRAVAMGQKLAVKAIELCDSLKAGPNPHVKVVRRRMDLPDSFASPAKLFQTWTYWHRIQFGDTWLLTIPGEAVCDIGLLIKELAGEKGAKLPLVIGLANDHLGYFVTPRQYAKGGYEATMCFYGPEVRKVLVRGVLGDLYPDYGLAKEDVLLSGSEIKRGEGPTFIRVSGDPYRMGYQHGKLLQKEIQEALDVWKPQLIKEIQPTYQKLIWKQPVAAVAVNTIGGLETVVMPALGMLSRGVLPKAPPDIYEEMRGIADGAGVHFDRILSMNAWLTLSMQGDIEKLAKSVNLCTNVVRIPDDSAKPVVHARNMDWDWASMLAPRTVVIEFRPEQGSAFLSVTWPGMAGVLTAVNDKGLSVAVESVGSQSEATLKNQPIMFTCRQIAQNDGELDGAVSRLTQNLPEGGFHVIMAQGEQRKAVSVDMCPTVSNVREPESGWLLGVVLEEMQEPYVGKAFAGPGITTIDKGERRKYEFIKAYLDSAGPELDSAEGWQKFLVRSDAGVCKDTTIYTTVLVPGSRELYVHRVGTDGADGYFRHALGK